MRIEEATTYHPAAQRAAMAAAKLVIFCLIGMALVAIATAIGDIPQKKLIVLAAAAAVGLVVFDLGLIKPALLSLWIIALTYNRMYFSFERIVGDQGSQGPYWIPGDVFFAALLAIWAWEVLVLKRRAEPAGPRWWPWLVPFGLTVLVSISGSSRPEWGVFESMRLLKVAMILCYIRYNVRGGQWWILVGSFVLAVMIQGAIGTLQMALRSSAGVLTMLGIGSGTLEAASEGQMAIGGWIRAAGTLAHPTNLAGYLLLTLPTTFALALSARRFLQGAVCWSAAAIGFAAMVFSLCRWPTLLSIVQLTLAAIALMFFRMVPAKRVLGLTAVAGFCVLLLALPFADSIERRISEDFSDSVDFRAHYLDIAIERTTPVPFFGIGLNNFGVDLLKYDPEIEWALDGEPKVRHEMKLRAFMTPHNLYLLIWTETGTVGILTFAVFLVGAFSRALRACFTADWEVRAACIGLTLGLAGLLGHGLVDFTLWVDPNLYSFAIAAGLLGVAADQRALTAAGGA